MYQRIEAVVVDLFHTLVDPEAFGLRGFHRVEEVARITGRPVPEMLAWWERILPTIVVAPTRPVDLLAEYLGDLVDPGMLVAADDAMGRYQDEALLNPIAGVVEALDGMRDAGLRVGLLSNAHERDIRAWDRSPLADRFDVVSMSCFTGYAKPDAAAYEQMLDALGCAAGSALFAGDGHGDELIGARRAGFGLVAAVTGPALRSGLRSPAEMADLAEVADVSLEDVAGIPALLGV